jgi:hypothetical protein
MCDSPPLQHVLPSPSESTCLLETSGKEHNNDNDTPIELEAEAGEQELARRLTLTAGTRAVLPSDSLSVSELLELHLPTVSSVVPSMDPELYFSNHPPTESVAIYLSRQVPPTTFVEGLRNVARQAVLNGKLSIMDWTCKNSSHFFSFELIEFWASLIKIIHARKKWEAALRWLNSQQAARGDLDKDVREVYLILQTTPWKADLQILRSRLTFLEMATFLSSRWLSSSQIDMALSLIAARQLQTSGHQEQCRFLIGDTILSELLDSLPLLHDTSPPLDYTLHAPQDLLRAGAHLERHQPDASSEVVFIAYSPPGHWAAISATSQGTLEWADSLGRRPPSTLVTGARNWLHYHLPSSSFSLGNNFQCTRQTDGYSCGIIALNAIKHRIFGDALWGEKDRAQLRIREFLDIMRMCRKIGGQNVRFHTISSSAFRLIMSPCIRNTSLHLSVSIVLWAQHSTSLCALHHPLY